jgi:hypothetical protein
MNLGANQVLDELGFEGFGIGHLFDTDGHGVLLGQLRSAVTPFSEDDLEAVFG